jgi:hypothetical protein
MPATRPGNRELASFRHRGRRRRENFPSAEKQSARLDRGHSLKRWPAGQAHDFQNARSIAIEHQRQLLVRRQYRAAILPIL